VTWRSTAAVKSAHRS